MTKERNSNWGSKLSLCNYGKKLSLTTNKKSLLLKEEIGTPMSMWFNTFPCFCLVFYITIHCMETTLRNLSTLSMSSLIPKIHESWNPILWLYIYIHTCLQIEWRVDTRSIKELLFLTKGSKNILSDIMCVIVATTMGTWKNMNIPSIKCLVTNTLM
jgi:hypothetical protein